jgi:hypothetical protein
VTEKDGVSDVSINPNRVGSENFAKIALSKPATKAGCQAAIKQEAPDTISVGQIQNDAGFCAESSEGLVAYITLKDIRAANADHAALLHVTAYR